MFIIKVTMVDKSGPLERVIDSASLECEDMEDASEVFDSIIEQHDFEPYESDEEEEED